MILSSPANAKFLIHENCLAEIVCQTIRIFHQNRMWRLPDLISPPFFQLVTIFSPLPFSRYFNGEEEN